MNETRSELMALPEESLFQLETPEGEVIGLRHSGRGPWFHVGHTGECDYECPSIPPGVILFRICLANPFFVVESGGRVTVFHEEARIEALGEEWCFRWREARELPSKLRHCELLPLTDVLKSGFFEEFDSKMRALRQKREWGESSVPPLSPGGAPTEDFLLALEDVAATRLESSAESLGELIWRSAQLLYWSLYGFGVLEPLLDDPHLKEILVNGRDEIFRESSRGLERVACGFGSEPRYEKFVESLLWQLGARLDSSTPVANGVLRKRYRLHVVSGQLASGSPVLSIRCFPEIFYSLESLLTDTPEGVKRLLIESVKSKRNILVCGETSSGKTTLLEALSEHIPASERVVVAEDVRELRLRNAHKVHLQTREGFGTDVAGFSLRALVRESLRMRPDRIVIGECRGAEALDLLQALNTGHAGSLTSIHGSNAQSALLRLETLALFGSSHIARDTVSALVAGGIDLVVLMGRSAEGRRCIREIAQVQALPPGKDEAYTLHRLFPKIEVLESGTAGLSLSRSSDAGATT